MNVQRLEHLIAVLRNVPPDRLRMEKWIGEDDCGTVACAAGWAALDPTFIGEGLHFNAYDAITCDGFVEYMALAKFFDVGHTTVHWLFDPLSYWRDTLPSQVITRIQHVLANMA